MLLSLLSVLGLPPRLPIFLSKKSTSPTTLQNLIAEGSLPEHNFARLQSLSSDHLAHLAIQLGFISYTNLSLPYI